MRARSYVNHLSQYGKTPQTAIKKAQKLIPILNYFHIGIAFAIICERGARNLSQFEHKFRIGIEVIQTMSIFLSLGYNMIEAE